MKWIQKIPLKKGALSRQLQIPIQKNIPVVLLKKIVCAKAGQTITNPTSMGKKRIKVVRVMKKRANLALNLKKIRRRK